MNRTTQLGRADEHAGTGATSISARACVAAGALCLSVSAILVELAGVDASTTAVLRCAVAAGVLIPMAWCERRRRGRQPTTAVVWSVVAGIALGVDYTAWTMSIYDVGAGIGTVLINVQVIVLPALAWMFESEKPSRRFVCAVPVMGCGIALVGGVGFESTGGASTMMSGTALGVLAGIGYGVYLYLSRRANAAASDSIVQALCWATCSAAITSGVLAQLGPGLSVSHIGVRSWGLLVALALSGQVLAWLFVSRGSVRLPPASTAALLLIQPILALALSAIVLGERLHPSQLVGAALVVGAVAVANDVVRGLAVWRPRTTAAGHGRMPAPVAHQRCRRATGVWRGATAAPRRRPRRRRRSSSRGGHCGRP